MLVVKVELWPLGNEGNKKNLGTMYIVNSGNGTKSLGHYEIMLSKWGRPEEPYRVGTVTGFDRLKGSPWDLLRRAINAATAHQNGDHGLRKRMVSIARRAVRGQTTMFQEETDDGDDQYGRPDDEDGGATPSTG